MQAMLFESCIDLTLMFVNLNTFELVIQVSLHDELNCVLLSMML